MAMTPLQALVDGVPPARGPLCVIDWSDQLARAEADLHITVLITIFGPDAGRAILDIQIIKTAVANSFNLDRDTMVLKRLHMDILLAENEETMSRLAHAGPSPGMGDYGSIVDGGRDSRSPRVLPCHPW